MGDLFGDERHIRMKELKRLEEHVAQHGERAGLVGSVLRILYVPVADLRPEEIVDRERTVLNAVVLENFAELLTSDIRRPENVLLVARQILDLGHRDALAEIRFLHLHEARGVPDLRAEIAADFELLLIDLRIAVERSDKRDRESESVGGVRVDKLQRIERIALRLRHLRTVGGADDTVDHDILKRRLAHKVDTRHHHARDPEEDDILGGYEIARRIELVEIGSLLRPAESRERPKPRAEPGVKNVGILLKVGERQSGITRLGLRLLERLLGGLGDKHQLLFPIPNSPFPAKRICRNSMPPPKLTRNAPILNILHPVEINLAPALGNELNLARLDGFDGGLGERLHLNEPLLRKTRFDDIVTAVAVTDLVVVIFDMIKITLGLEIGDERLAAFEAVHTDVLRARKLVHVAVVGHDVDLFETVTLTYEEVVGIVGGRNLDDTGTELLLDVIVGENGNLAARKRKNHVLADNRGETLVLRIDRDRRIAGKRFRTRRRDTDIILVKLTLRAEGAARDGIADIPEVTVIRLVLDLVVRESRTAAGTPVYDVIALVDEALVVKLSKDLRDGLRATLIEGKALARPVG